MSASSWKVAAETVAEAMARLMVAVFVQWDELDMTFAGCAL
jgi:hypothetical protein